MLLNAIFFSFFYKSTIRKGIILEKIASCTIHKVYHKPVEILAVFTMRESLIGSRKPYS
jgi:hypothetical protein